MFIRPVGINKTHSPNGGSGVNWTSKRHTWTTEIISHTMVTSPCSNFWQFATLVWFTCPNLNRVAPILSFKQLRGCDSPQRAYADRIPPNHSDHLPNYSPTSVVCEGFHTTFRPIAVDHFFFLPTFCIYQVFWVFAEIIRLLKYILQR